jgi:hypothetical protein
VRRRLAPLLACAALAGCGGETDDEVVDAVPSDARAYVHLDRDSDDWAGAREALRRMPAIEGYLLDALAGAVELPGEGEAGVAFVPEPVVVTPDDRAVERSLADLPAYVELLEELSEERFVHAYIGRDALGELAALDGTIRAAAVSADLIDDRVLIRARARHDGAGGPCSAGRGGTELLEVADPDAALYVEIPSIGCAVRTLAARVEGAGLALGRFARAARRRGGVALADELLPLFDRRGALIAAPGEAGPTLTLIVDDVEEEAALDLLARLQPALSHLLRAEELGQAPTFGAVEVEGVTAATARLAPGLELSYAAWDGRLVVSTSLAGIAAVRRADGLPGSDRFEAVLGDRPDAPAALVFLDLDQLLALGEQAGLAEDPRYLAVRDDLQKLRAAGAVLSRERDFTTAELTFQIP